MSKTLKKILLTFGGKKVPVSSHICYYELLFDPVSTRATSHQIKPVTGHVCWDTGVKHHVSVLLVFVVQFIVMSLLFCVNIFPFACNSKSSSNAVLSFRDTHTHLGWTHFMHCHLHLSSCQLCPAWIKRVQIHTSRHTHWFNFRWQLHLRVLWRVCACVKCLFVLFWGAQPFTHYLK